MEAPALHGTQPLTGFNPTAGVMLTHTMLDERSHNQLVQLVLAQQAHLAVLERHVLHLQQENKELQAKLAETDKGGSPPFVQQRVFEQLMELGKKQPTLPSGRPHFPQRYRKPSPQGAVERPSPAGKAILSRNYDPCRNSPCLGMARGGGSNEAADNPRPYTVLTPARQCGPSWLAQPRQPPTPAAALAPFSPPIAWLPAMQLERPIAILAEPDTLHSDPTLLEMQQIETRDEDTKAVESIAFSPSSSNSSVSAIPWQPVSSSCAASALDDVATFQTAGSNISLLSNPPARDALRPASRLGNYSQQSSAASLMSAACHAPADRLPDGLLVSEQLLSSSHMFEDNSIASSARSASMENMAHHPKNRRVLPAVPLDQRLKARKCKSSKLVTTVSELFAASRLEQCRLPSYAINRDGQQRTQSMLLGQYGTDECLKAIRTIQTRYRQYRMRKQFAEARIVVLQRTEQRQSPSEKRWTSEQYRLSLDRLSRFSQSFNPTVCGNTVHAPPEGLSTAPPATSDETICPAEETDSSSNNAEAVMALDALQQSMMRLRSLTNAASSCARYLNVSPVSDGPNRNESNTDGGGSDDPGTSLDNSSVPQFLASVSFKHDVLAVEEQRLRRIGIWYFNVSPDKGIAHLIAHHLLPADSRDIALLLHTEETLNRGKIGEYLGGTTVQHLEVLQQYVNLFRFAGMTFDAALRHFLTSFRLPGEAQKIERILEVFAMNYHRHNHGVFRHSDTPFILAFSLVMLNTDSHNPANKNKMTKEQFVRNNSGIDAGDNLPQDFLEEIYNRIVQNAFQPKPDNLTLVEDILDTFGPQARPDLADLIQPWQQFIGVCNVTELEDLGRPSLRGKHCRTFFLFNEYLLVAKAKGSHKYALRQVIPLLNLSLRRAPSAIYKDAFYLIDETESKVLYLFNMDDIQTLNVKFEANLRQAVLDCEIVENERAPSPRSGHKSTYFVYRSLNDLDSLLDDGRSDILASPALTRKKSMRARLPSMFNKLKRNLQTTPRKSRPTSAFALSITNSQ